MILIEKTQIMGLEPTIRGMRNPMNSWAKSDTTFYDDGEYHDICGNSGPANAPDDCDMARAGSADGKFRRMIAVYVDITAPLYWWKEFDTYKVGTVANSCSTMHRIHAKEFEPEDFSHDHLMGDGEWFDVGDIHGLMEPLKLPSFTSRELLQIIIGALNCYRKRYLETKDKLYWWQMIQLLPSSYNQKRTVMLNYEVLSNIYQHRRNHKLDEWRELCKWIEGLPYSEVITCNAKAVDHD